MSISSSIFQKPCPACAITVSIGADRCQCGHIFESSQNQSPQEIALRDEELYESYLSARVQQARQAADNAEQALAEKPRDPELISAAELAREVARSIEVDLDAQRVKIAALRRALPPKPVVLPPLPKLEVPVVPPEVTVKVALTTVVAKPVSVPPAVVAPAPVAAAISTPAAPPVSAPPPEVEIELKAVASEPVVKPKTVVKPVAQASAAHKAAEVLAALKSAKAREAARRAREALEAEAKFAKQVAANPDILVQAVPNSVPPAAFRQDQAAKAERVMETRKSAEEKECPNCTASVPNNTSRCHCGFAFISGNSDLPSLTLCTGDFTALRNSLKLNLR